MKFPLIDSMRSYLQNLDNPSTGFIRVQITNLTPPGKKEIQVRFVETHDENRINMIDISGESPIIHNYTKDIRTLGGKQEEIHDPIQLKFMALWCAKDWTIHMIREKLGYSYRQARYIKQYQKSILGRDSENSALLFLNSHFSCEQNTMKG